MLLAVTLTAAAASAAEAPPLAILDTIPEEAVGGQGPIQPSPGLRYLALPPRCDRDRTLLPLVSGGAAASTRQEELPGRLQALAWLDDGRYALVRVGKGGATLAIGEPGAAPRVLDTLPPSAEEAGCGLRSASYRLEVAPGGGALALALRRGESLFEVRRYALPEGGRSVQETRAAAAPPRHRLWQAIPSPTSADVLLVWQSRDGAAPRRRLDLLEGGLGPVSAPTVTTLARASEDLDDCAFTAAGQVLCHHRAGVERGWLWLLGRDGSVRQLSRAGHAAAFATSPTGDAVAYVGSGAQDGPLVVQDLSGGAPRSLSLGPATCDSAASLPSVHWLAGGRLLGRGYCAAALRVVGPGAAAVAAQEAAPPAPAPAPPSLAVPAEPAAAAPVAHAVAPAAHGAPAEHGAPVAHAAPERPHARAHRAASEGSERRHGRDAPPRRKETGAFWRPRF